MAATHTLHPSNASPHILQPLANSTTNKPLAPAPNPAPVTNQLGPKKEWTVPPRPKPGRKPALDAPPTKRKAQNREAQRAFRERRAAKVGELEEQMKQMEEEDSREQGELRNEIKGLQAEVEKWQRISEGWREECKKSQSLLNRERQSKQHMDLQSQILRETMEMSTDAVPLKPRTGRHDKLRHEHQGGVAKKSEGLEDITCGRCSNDSRCQCIEDAFDMGDITTGTADDNGFKRPLSRQNRTDNGKRMRIDNEAEEEPQEIDFTTRQTPALPKGSSSSSIPVATTTLDSCGFCQDGTPCICAEIDRQNENGSMAPEKSNKSSSVNSNQLSSSCTNNPGTCAQCQAIPESKSFCTSLAASRAFGSAANDGKAASPSTTEATLNCADAFNKLAQHPYFPKASTQLNTWMPQLATKAEPVNLSSHSNNLEGRTAFEIEAASVMNVLKSFDVRFGEISVNAQSSQQN